MMSGQIILLLFTVLLFALCIYRGYRRSIAGIIYSILSWIFIIVFIRLVTLPLAVYIESMSSETRIAIQKAIADSVRFFGPALSEPASEAIISLLSKALALICAFIIAKIICVAVRICIEMVLNIPIAGKGLRIAGAAVGFLEACLYVSVFLFVLSKIEQNVSMEEVQQLVETVRATPVLSTLYEQNPLVMLYERLI